MILCGTAVNQLDDLAAYNIVKPSVESKVDENQVIEDLKEFMTFTQGQGHDDAHPELKGLNVTVDSDRSFDNDISNSGNELTLSDDPNTDTSLENVVSSDVDKFKAEQVADVTLQKAWSLANVNKGHFFIKK